MISDEWGCIREHPALARYRLIRYRRRGYGGSVAHNGPFSLAQQASDALGVLTHFGLDRAHVVGQDRAMTDVGSSLEVEGPALGEWMISDKDLAGISQPALTVVGAESIPWLQESVAWLSDHLPNAETFKLPAAGHMLHMIDPDGMATAIGAFFGRHPL